MLCLWLALYAVAGASFASAIGIAATATTRRGKTAAVVVTVLVWPIIAVAMLWEDR